ncbi:DgyrCDS9600 [Dimorphilus gyrociliatus]|uniref:DgyrCDS9600 n=1 Tax=Dimorphilus gyrociliatus TaxID=2664684 RepID=A0A7I8VXG8_9ANNE|nr:DgyrCDS9600 [Dimorphilus gyrociliatus]
MATALFGNRLEHEFPFNDVISCMEEYYYPATNQEEIIKEQSNRYNWQNLEASFNYSSSESVYTRPACSPPNIGMETNDLSFNDADFDYLTASVSSYGNPEYVQQAPQMAQLPQNRSNSPKMGRTKPNIQLWQFLRKLLSEPALYGKSIRWINESEGVFKIDNSNKVAELWGKEKHCPRMNYDKLSRSIRTYYKKNIIVKPPNNARRLVYQFCPSYR